MWEIYFQVAVCCFRYYQKGLVTLKNKNDKEPKKKYNMAELKQFFRDLDGINGHQDFQEGEIAQTGR